MDNLSHNQPQLLHQLSIAPHVIISLCLLLISIVSLVGNLTSLYVIRKILSFHTQQWFLISVIIVINIILGLSILPTTVIAFILNYNIFSSSTCTFLGFLSAFTNLIQAFIVALTLVHQIAHLNPTYLCIRHRGYKKLSKPYLILCTILTFFFAMLPLLNMATIGLGEYKMISSIQNCWIDIGGPNNRIVSIIFISCFFLPYLFCLFWLLDLILLSLSKTISGVQYQYPSQNGGSNVILRTISTLIIAYLSLNLPNIVKISVERISPGRISSTLQMLFTWLGFFFTTITPIIMACNHSEFTQVYARLGKLIRSSTSNNVVHPSGRSTPRKTTIPIIKIDKVDNSLYPTTEAKNIYNIKKSTNEEANQKYLSVGKSLSCNKPYMHKSDDIESKASATARVSAV
ncbi:hypothetical protein TrispH2_002041 [Trichoplax sp. H2]|nr:hypothetical protein TrispH2_002041 [Trichoplax sp. H2]|eukprot:RDD46520.1 hypothetical protein TrispH2_002041 [Trichoplax sp. H2]